jgi:hypothetical protein
LHLRVNQAIDRGVAHLRQDWGQPKAYQIYLGLLGLTLLECGVPRNDPAVTRIADLVRSQQRNLDAIYELSLAIVFLDRLGDPNDAGIIRAFARRLLEAQNDSGPWGYTCFRWSASRPAGRNSPRPLINWPQDVFSDNSNTQFAVLGLWVAQRHGVSVGKALRLTAQYFRRSQGDDGSWTYTPKAALYKHSMTCAALFCLAAERGESPGYVRTIPPRATILEDDSTITRGLRFLGKSFDAIAKGDAIDSWSKLYFLWSLERVAAIYGLETIGSQEWYPWTAELLVRIQRGNGSWVDPGPGPVPTCFALLILRRSNLTPDLLVGVPGLTQPRKLTGVTGQPLVKEQPRKLTGVTGQPPLQKPSSSRVPSSVWGQRPKPRADRSAELPVSQGPVHGPEQTLTLNIHIRNADAWPDIKARLKALLDSPKGTVKLNTISGAYYWVAVAPVKGDPDVFARKVKFAKVVAVHMDQRLIYLDAEPSASRVPTPVSGKSAAKPNRSSSR